MWLVLTFPKVSVPIILLDVVDVVDVVDEADVAELSEPLPWGGVGVSGCLGPPSFFFHIYPAPYSPV